MNDIIFFGEREYPSIEFRKDGRLILRGNSFPVNAAIVYEPLINFVSDLTVPLLHFEIDLENLNVNTIRNLYMIFQEIERNDSIEHGIVFWKYNCNEPEKLEVGELLQNITKKCHFVYKQDAVLAS